MLWSDKQLSDFKKLVVEGYSTCVLGQNEYVPPSSLTQFAIILTPIISQTRPSRPIEHVPRNGPRVMEQEHLPSQEQGIYSRVARYYI